MTQEEYKKAVRRSAWFSYLVLAAMVAATLFCHGCKCQPVIETIEKERIVEVHTRDTAIVTQADSASLRALLRCDSAYNVVLYDLVCLQGERIDATAHT